MVDDVSCYSENVVPCPKASVLGGHIHRVIPSFKGLDEPNKNGVFGSDGTTE